MQQSLQPSNIFSSSHFPSHKKEFTFLVTRVFSTAASDQQLQLGYVAWAFFSDFLDFFLIFFLSIFLLKFYSQPQAINNYSWDMWPGPCPEIPRYLGSLDLPEVLHLDLPWIPFLSLESIFTHTLCFRLSKMDIHPDGSLFATNPFLDSPTQALNSYSTLYRCL